MMSALHFIFLLAATFTEISTLTTDVEDLEQYLQPNLISDKDYFKEASCYRPCEEGALPKICYYKWTLNNYKTMGPACRHCPTNMTDCFRPHCITADGFERGIVTVNHQLPGPSIQVCFGDRIVVDVVNGLLGQSSTIHWHGAHMNGAPQMDGVPMITQCPITEMTTFRYDYKATNFGTIYWHSHDGFQKQDGIQGSMVVRTYKSMDPNAFLYDYDLASHVIFISDWMHSTAGEHFPGLTSHDMFQQPDSVLLNGRGRLTEGLKASDTPYPVLRVTASKKYRFRLVGGMCTSCAYRFAIGHHSLLVIAVDGCPIEPVRVNSIDMYAGERYDFVLEASEALRSYWIHFKAVGNCNGTNLYTLGILRYNGDKTTVLTDPGFAFHPEGKVLNPYNGKCGEKDKHICISQLKTSLPVPHRITSCEPDFTYKLAFGFHMFSVEDLSQPGEYERYFEPKHNKLLASVVNNISYEMPHTPMLSQRQDIKPSAFCPAGYDGVPRCPHGSEDFCECIHLIRIPLGAVVQFVLIDNGFGGINHPFHMHGYSFSVIKMGKLGKGEKVDDIIEGLRRQTLHISQSPPSKDTLAVPAKGYAVIRIVADNPGYWFFHCHILYHADTGMAVVLQVGDHREMPHVPTGFPKCGDYTPPLHNEYQQYRVLPFYNKGDGHEMQLTEDPYTYSALLEGHRKQFHKRPRSSR